MDPNSIEAVLRADIANGALGPGAVLRQEALAARFGVSRQPIRQVLERLRTAGLVARRSDRSLAVVGHSANEARELLGLRIALETSALRLSLPNLDAAELRRARHAADEFLHAGSAEVLEELDRAFHAALYGACGNARMLALIEDLRRESGPHHATPGAVPKTLESLAEEHQRIWRACADRDRDAAVAALVAHLGAS